jgi:hypothetical protein
MVSKRLRDVKPYGLARGVAHVRIGSDAILGHDGVAIEIGVIHVKSPAVRESGRKGQAQQSLFATCVSLGTDIEKWLRQQGAIAKHPNETILLNKEQPARSVPGVLNIRRRSDAGGNRCGADRLSYQVWRRARATASVARMLLTVGLHKLDSELASVPS